MLAQPRRLECLHHSYSGSCFPHGLESPPGIQEVDRRRAVLVAAPPTPANEDGPYGHLPFFGVVVGICDGSHTVFMARGIVSEARQGSVLRLAGFSFDLSDLAEDLVAARRRGVTVEVMLDKVESSQGRGSTANQFQQVRALAVQGVQIHGGPLEDPYRGTGPRSYGRQMGKAVWSECRAFIGSADWTRVSTKHSQMGIELRINARGWTQLDAWWDSIWHYQSSGLDDQWRSGSARNSTGLPWAQLAFVAPRRKWQCLSGETACTWRDPGSRLGS